MTGIETYEKSQVSTQVVTTRFLAQSALSQVFLITVSCRNS